MVFMLSTKGSNETTGQKARGSLNLIDLAGSERLGRSGVSGERLKETQNINKSLSGKSLEGWLCGEDRMRFGAERKKGRRCREAVGALRLWPACPSLLAGPARHTLHESRYMLSAVAGCQQHSRSLATCCVA